MSTQGNWQAYAALQDMAQRSREWRQLKRERQIDEGIMGRLLQGDTQGAQQFAMSQIMPAQRGGFMGVVDRLSGGPAAPRLTPLQQQIMGTTAERAFPTMAETRAAERHPYEMDYLQSRSDYYAGRGDRTQEMVGEISRTINSLSTLARQNVTEEYDEDIKALTRSLRQLVEGMVGGPNQGGAAGPAAATPWQGPNEGVLPLRSSAPTAAPRPPAAAAPAAARAQQGGGPKHLRLRRDTPPDIQRLISDAMKQGIPVEEILSDAEVAPYVQR